MERTSCTRTLPGCQVELLRFEEDYVKYRCLPQSAPSWQVNLAKDTLEVFKDVEKASCCVSNARHAALTANIGTLEAAAHAAGLCVLPYTSIPDYSAGAFQCHAMAECDDVLEDFEDDYVNHGCMPTGNVVHDEFAKSLLEVFKNIDKANCCVVRAQRLRLAADMLWLGTNTGCTPKFPVSRTGVVRRALAPATVTGEGERPPAPRAADRPRRARSVPSRHGGGGGGVTTASVVAGTPASASTSAATPTDMSPVAAATRSTYTYDGNNPAQCCFGNFHMSSQCCDVFCKWVVAYLGTLVTQEECCVGHLLTPLQWSC